jgi:hypothetical protein
MASSFQLKGKDKVKLSLCLTKHHAMKTYGESGSLAPRILWPRHKMEVGGQLHDPPALHPGKEPHWIGGWVGPRAYLGTVSKKKFQAPAEIRTPIFQPVDSRYIDWAICQLFFSSFPAKILNVLFTFPMFDDVRKNNI